MNHLPNEEETLTLYHISSMFDPEVAVFTPRVPKSCDKWEEQSIPRICVSPTLDGCLLAHPTTVFHLVESLKAEYAYLHEEEDTYRHKLLEHGKTGMFFRVYRFEVSKEEVLDPEYLYKKEYVFDALKTREHWLLKETQPVEVSYLFVEGAVQHEKTGKVTFTYQTYDSLEACGRYLDYETFQFLARCCKKYRDRLDDAFTQTETDEIWQEYIESFGPVGISD